MKLVLFLIVAPLFAQQVIVLRPAGAGALPERIEVRGTAQMPDRSISDVSEPTLTAYLPDAAIATGGSLIICPGGGYGHLAIDKEGHDVARWLQSIGYAGFVLKYRLPGSMKGTLGTVQEAAQAARLPIEDAADAVRLVRANAVKWGLKPGAVGMIGFSAGGNLAALMGITAPDATRPDFLVLAYPAIPKSLEGLPATVPPTFLVHADDDRLGAADNSVPFYLALKRLKRPAELHIYSSGGHGFGIKKTKATSAAWPAALRAWLEERVGR
ncbi:MAG TPA: alpha/beta hydrolase [Paludibaculum sp.]|jgi:acetyl esterase/lipase